MRNTCVTTKQAEKALTVEYNRLSMMLNFLLVNVSCVNPLWVERDMWGVIACRDWREEEFFRLT